MKKLPFSLLFLLGYLSISHSIQLEIPSGSGSTYNVTDANTQALSPKTGRAIGSSSRSQNRVSVSKSVNEEEELSDVDSAFDASPQKSVAGGEIIFPPSGLDPDTSKTIKFTEKKTKPRRFEEVVKADMPKNKWQKIPLKALLGLGLNETKVNLEELFAKHVSNVRVGHDDRSGAYLTDSEGQPLINENNQTIIIKPRPSSRGRTNSLATRVSADVSHAIPQSRTLSLPKTTINELDNAPSKLYETALNEICIPETKSVPLPIEVIPYMIVIPKCARVKRCGGCCLLENLECQPLSTKMTSITVQKFAYTGNISHPLYWQGLEEVEIEEHTKCSCQCKYKPEHCNQFQEYREQECTCACKNEDARRNCVEDENKRWDENSCMCSCRDFQECSSGQYFDLNTCSCKDDEITRRRFG